MYRVELRRLNQIILIEYLAQYFVQKRHSMLDAVGHQYPPLPFLLPHLEKGWVNYDLQPVFINGFIRTQPCPFVYTFPRAYILWCRAEEL